MAETRRVCPTCGGAYGAGALFCPRDGAPLAARAIEAGADPYVGLRVAPGVTLDRLIGIGSMGRVYRAWQSGIERAVAVKILHREHARDATLVARFEREGRVAGGLAHPHVLVIHAAGELEPYGTHAGGEPYLVTEFLDGLSLRSALVAADGALPLIRALRIILHVCDGVGEAHAHGIVHRDLKPENVMLVSVGRDPDFVKVLDFGVARVGEADSSLATHAGAILGTATYACPESARGDRVGAPGDVYSIATVLFECVSGRPPFAGKGPVDVLIQHAQSAAPDVRTIPCASHVPDAIAGVIANALAKNPNDRPRNGRELGRALLLAASTSGLDLGSSMSRTLLGADGRPSPAQAAYSTTDVVGSITSHTVPNFGNPKGAS